MPNFSEKSLNKLKTCHEDIQEVLKEAVKHFDFTILEGHRGAAEQDRLYSIGKSKLKFPKSRHNQLPSMAVDIAPYPIDWEDRERFTYLAGHIMGIGQKMGILLRWGGDWGRTTDLKHNHFDDLPHFELIKEN